jgi:hypothetical protein
MCQIPFETCVATWNLCLSKHDRVIIVTLGEMFFFQVASMLDIVFNGFCKDLEDNEDDVCDYMLFFARDPKKEIVLWPNDDDFKQLI